MRWRPQHLMSAFDGWTNGFQARMLQLMRPLASMRRRSTRWNAHSTGNLDVLEECDPSNTHVIDRLHGPSDSDRRNTLPSWLLSLVTHLTILVVIAALASRPGGRAGSIEPVVITLSQYDGPEDANASVRFQTGGQVATGPEETTSEPNLEMDPVDSNPRESPADAQEPTEQTRLRLRGQLSEAEIRKQLQQPLVHFHDKAGEAKTVRIAYKPLDTPASNSGSTLGQSEDARNTTSDSPIQSWRMDDIVDRFIQYDIGQLRGLAGSQARWQFERLGPESIPALVRGLNKAAKIRASCPIAVITSRLDRMLSQTNDSDLIKYAIENVGRGIDFRAPHRRAVQQLAYRWRKMYAATGNRTDENEYQGLQSSPFARSSRDRDIPAEGRRWNDWRNEILAPQ